MQPGQTFGVAQRGADGGDRNRRGVGAQDAVAPDDAFEIGKERLLLLQVLDDGLDDQAGVGEVGDLVGGEQAHPRSGGIG